MSDPYYLGRLTKMNNRLLETIEANKKKKGYTVNESGEVKDEDLFYSITSKFKGKVILVDFWATWCKNCTVMEKKTFKDETVEKRLRNYVVVKVQAEQPDRSPAKEMLEAFETRGLPGFAVLKLK